MLITLKPDWANQRSGAVEKRVLGRRRWRPVMDGCSRLVAGFQRQRAQLGAVGIGEGDVDHFGPVVEGRGPPGAIDQLVGYHQVARAVLGHQASAAHGPTMRSTPSSRIAHRLARYGTRCGGY